MDEERSIGINSELENLVEVVGIDLVILVGAVGFGHIAVDFGEASFDIGSALPETSSQVVYRFHSGGETKHLGADRNPICDREEIEGVFVGGGVRLVSALEG